MLLCAVWYGTTWSLVLWGLYHAALLALERRGLGAAIKRLPAVVRHAYVLAVIVFGWVLLRSETPAAAAAYLKAMAGLNATGRPFGPALAPEIVAALVAGIIGSVPLARMLARWSVVIDAATTSALMMLFATIVFVWRRVSLLVSAVLFWWPASLPTRGDR